MLQYKAGRQSATSQGERRPEQAVLIEEEQIEMNRVFIYWDNSNIFHEAQRFAEERNEGPGARFRVRIHFDNIFRLAHAGRPVQRAVAAGSISTGGTSRNH